METKNIIESEMACLKKEVEIHNMVKSEHCVRLYSSIKTGSNLYMLMDYCNGMDLGVLLRQRKALTQVETA